MSLLDLLFSSNHNNNKSWCGLCFWASDPLIESLYYYLSINGTKPKSKGLMNFYKCCDLTKKVYLVLAYSWKNLFCENY